MPPEQEKRNAVHATYMEICMNTEKMRYNVSGGTEKGKNNRETVYKHTLWCETKRKWKREKKEENKQQSVIKTNET